MMSNKMQFKYEYGNLVYFLGHILKITELICNQFGNRYKLECHSSGCCKYPNNLILEISEKDIIKHEGRDLEVDYSKKGIKK
jgi:hypothetical protein